MPNHQVLGIERAWQWIRRLRRWQVHLRLAGPLQATDPDLAHNADDSASVIQMPERLADRVAGEKGVAFGPERGDDVSVRGVRRGLRTPQLAHRSRKSRYAH